jgi:hypothetical protein
MSKPEIFREPLSKETIERLAQEEFGDMIKFVVDLDRGILCAGGGLHSDEEQLLLDDGSGQSALWGANYYWQDPSDQRFEFTSMINVRPKDGNTSQDIQSIELQQRIRKWAMHYFESSQ